MGFKKTLNNLFGSKEEHECMKILDMLDRIVDQEADEGETEKFHEHIEKCMPCYQQYNLDKEIKELIRHRCNNQQVPVDLVDAIRLQISQSERG